MEHDKEVIWEALGAVVILLIVTAIVVHATVGWSDVGAAWVQAVGSVLALFVTGGAVVWQVRSRQKESGRVVAERLKARVAVIELLLHYLDRYIVYQDQLAAGIDKKSAEGRASHIVLKMAMDEVLQVQLLEMPTEKCVTSLATCRSIIGLLTNPKMAPGADMFSPRRVGTYKVARAKLKDRIDQLRSEADRIGG